MTGVSLVQCAMVAIPVHLDREHLCYASHYSRVLSIHIGHNIVNRCRMSYNERSVII